MKRITAIAVSLITALLLTQSVPVYSVGLQRWIAAQSDNGMNNTGSVSSLTTDNITEGVLNMYYMDNRTRAAMSASVPLSYNSSTGVFSLGTVPITSGGTGSGTTPTKGQMLIGNDNGTFKLNTLSAGSNVTITNDNGSVTIAASTGGAPTWGNIGGTLSSQSDLQNAFNAKEPSIATGTIGQWRNGTKNWFTLYSDNVTEGTANQYFTAARAVAAIGSGSSGKWYNGTNNWFPLYTDNITQGTNKWYTDASARAAISVSSPLVYNSSTGVMSINGLSATPTYGQIMIGNSDNATFSLNTLTAGSNVTITPGNGSISISSTGVGLSTSNKWYNGTDNFFQLYADNVTSAVKRTTTTLGDTMYDNGTALVRLAGNQYTQPQFLQSAGSGSAATAPTWDNSTGSGNVVLATNPQFTGNIGLNIAASSSKAINIQSALSNSSTETGLVVGPTFDSSATAAYGEYIGLTVGAGSYTINNMYGLFIDSPAKGSNPTITTNYGIYVAAQTLGGTNYAQMFSGGLYTTTGVSWTNGSSVRWKTNIDNLTGALQLVNQLQPVRFMWDAEHGGTNSIGFIAEDFGKVIPELTDDDPNAPGYKMGIRYGEITSLLVSASREQNAQTNGLIESFAGALTNYNSVFVMPESVPLNNTTARTGVINGGLQLAPGTQVKPVCDDSHRGTHWFVAASDNSTDYEEVCSYVSGVIGWRKITWQ
ncbi:tail fiber domain-containing protein [Candidatus Magnetominusculus dajiuhuensis]|uniref:tail fiber domain-containing protein n=1 Tax=Candidatus Magnetominusculus dajiuhuensis TaxID=3137712 RepID=UPI003B42A1A1